MAWLLWDCCWDLFLIVVVMWFCYVFVCISHVGITCVVVVVKFMLQCWRMFFGWGFLVRPLCCIRHFGLAVLVIVWTYVARVFLHLELPPGIGRRADGRVMFRLLVPHVFLFWFRSFRFCGVFFVACNHSASPPGGNQVDGLPPA